MTSNGKIKILLVEDHEIVRTALRMMMDNWPEWEVAGEAATAPEALEKASLSQPDIILLDVNLRGESGLAILPELLSAAPQSKVLLLTGSQDQEIHRLAVRSGAKGVVLKDQAVSTLAKAIEKVHAGEIWLDAALVAGLLEELSVQRERAKLTPDEAQIASLTERERELILLIADGLQNKQIAKKLGISEKTVAYHLTTVFSKLRVGSRLELLVFAYQHGLVGPSGK